MPVNGVLNLDVLLTRHVTKVIWFEAPSHIFLGKSHQVTVYVKSSPPLRHVKSQVTFVFVFLPFYQDVFFVPNQTLTAELS